MELHVAIQLGDKFENLPTEQEFETWVKTALESRTPQAEICIRIVSKDESAELNQQYRQKTGPTNVLSFDSSLPAAVAEGYLIGDLVICAPLVVEEANELACTPIEHWAHLTIHGCLHLVGYDHEQDAEAEVMEALETQLMQQLGFADPYKEQH